jgi:hypothetical protein
MNLSFARKESSQYRQEAYYWRGGDALREREYLADEYKRALVEFRRAESDLRSVECDVRQASELLHEREEYTRALANFLDSDAAGGQNESSLKRRLAALEGEIRDAEAELQEARAVHHPAIASGLQKEKAYLLIENQRCAKAINIAEEQHGTSLRQLAACTVSRRYRSALDLEWRTNDLTLKNTFLRQAVSHLKKLFDATRPVIATAATSDAKSERAALVTQVELEEAINRLEEKRQRRPRKWDIKLRRTIDAIDELNERMKDLGLRDDLVDTDTLRQQHIPRQKDQP